MNLRTFVRGAAVLALPLAFAACQGGPGPTGIADPDPGPATVTVNGVDLLVAPPGLTPAGAAVVGEVGPDGGSIAVGGGRLDVPAGALGESVSISMEGPLDSTYVYRFGPDGLAFEKGATLSIAVDPESIGVDDPSRLKIAGASESGDDWQVIGGTYDEATGTVVWQIEHFSKYGLCFD